LILEDRATQAYKKNLATGMSRTDAQEEANRDWLMMDPEETEALEENPEQTAREETTN
jgi:hypothetical protein